MELNEMEHEENLEEIVQGTHTERDFDLHLQIETSSDEEQDEIGSMMKDSNSKFKNGFRESLKMNSSEFSDSSDEEFHQKEVKLAKKKASRKIVPRPNASAGYWLCCLLPLALSSRFLHDYETECTTTYKTLTIAAIGMGVESVCFYAYMHVKSWLFMKLFISLVPSLLTSALFKYVMEMSWGHGMLWGFGVTFSYQNVYIRVMRGLQKCFTYGEASVLIQGLVLFVLNVVLQLPDVILNGDIIETDDFTQLNVIMLSALFFLLITCALIALFKFLRDPMGFYPLMVLLLFAVTCAPVTRPLPVIALFEFLFKDTNRLKYIFYFFAFVFFTIGTVYWQLRHTQKASTRTRKIFHVLIILVYIPGLLYQCAFLYISSGVALAIFTVLELFRILEIPPIGSALKDAFVSFSDEKDAGILALTPFSLLIGCSLPIWLHPCPCKTAGTTEIALLAGILSTGIGDAAASVIGSKYGRIKWRDSSRSLEGSAAFVISISLSAFVLAALGLVPMTLSRWIITLVATIVTALIEAHTDQIDNLVLPLVFYTLVNMT